MVSTTSSYVRALRFAVDWPTGEGFRFPVGRA